MYKCKICSKEFELKKEFHYISRDKETTGIVNVAKKEEVKIFDTFDCPHCGCQNVMQERKRKRADKSNAIAVCKKAEDKSEEKEDCDVEATFYADTLIDAVNIILRNTKDDRL